MKFKFVNVVLISLVANNTFATSLSTKLASPKDPGVVNHERIQYWLEKRGLLTRNASEEQRRLAIESFINRKSTQLTKLPADIQKDMYISTRTPSRSAITVKGVKGLEKQRQLANSEVTTTVKVLALLVDFPDLKHDNNRLTAADTPMFYDDYAPSHYSELLFSTTGYLGPTGQNIESAHQFYQHESGGSLFFTGQVHGWITADNDAAHYGENDDEGDDKDVPALVLEAVSKAVSELNINLADYDKTDLFDIDGDGNVNEPDGIIDHVMLFHSSVGEEAGGGVLAEDAVWSHRFFVFDPETNQPVAVPGSDIRLYGYTINPIDAATGVVVHEFGHDLGLPDEYDTENGLLGSPVGDWSVMASGSWVGSPEGTRPVGFSPYARDELQRVYQGNWINQLSVDFANLDTQVVELVDSVNHEGAVNQVKVMLPKQLVDFGAPFAGDYQYYSNLGHNLRNQVMIIVDIPNDTPRLRMMARWSIEEDYDYAQVLVNGNAIAGSHTATVNAQHNDVTNFLTGESKEIDGAQGELGWVPLTFDLADYAGQQVEVTLIYVTDPAVGGYGIVVDELNILSGESVVISDVTETTDNSTFNGFSRMGDKIEAKPHYYYVQLRSHNGVDVELKESGYDAGVLVWYRNENIVNNEVKKHPGDVFIGVVDADQNPIIRNGRLNSTGTQIRDAAFSLYQQSSQSGDNHLTANAFFSDKNDYSAPHQPESGIDLPIYGLAMNVVTQSTESTSATIELSNQGAAHIVNTHDGLTVSLSLVNAEVKEGTDIVWIMGDGTTLTGNVVTHTYASAGEFDISLAFETESASETLEKLINVGEKITGNIEASIDGRNVSYTAELAGGKGVLTYRWNFGDGSNVSMSSSPSHEYETTGNFTVTLTVTDDTSHSTIFTYEVQIDESLNVAIARTINNLSVNFRSTVSGGDENYQYAWNFGDGNMSELAAPSHTYAAAGNYTVTLTVTDGNGISSTDTSTVMVSAAVIPTTNSGGSGGGSFGYALLLLGFIASVRKMCK